LAIKNNNQIKKLKVINFALIVDNTELASL